MQSVEVLQNTMNEFQVKAELHYVIKEGWYIAMLHQMFKSVIDQDRAAVVICDTEHTIVYMNPAAVQNYANRGGAELVGKSLLACHNERSNDMIRKIVSWFADSKEHNMIHTFYNEKQNKDVYMVALRDEDGELLGYYEKHEFRNKETAKMYDFEQSLV